MTKWLVATLLAIGVSTAAVRTSGPACAQTEFKTQMIKAACAASGQDEAKKQMIAFVAKNGSKGEKLTKSKIFTCNACHEKLDPNFERKAEAYDLFTKLGGK